MRPSIAPLASARKVPDADWRPARSAGLRARALPGQPALGSAPGRPATSNARLAALDVKKLTEGMALNLVGIFIKNRYYADNGIDYATQQCIEGFGTLDLPQQIAGLQAAAARRRGGPPRRSCTTARCPRCTRCCCRPRSATRSSSSGRREYDPVHVGFRHRRRMTMVTMTASGSTRSIAGNHNTGHAFAADAATWAKHPENPKANPLPHGVIGPEFTDEQRFDIIEYLKVHRDLPETPRGLSTA